MRRVPAAAVVSVLLLGGCGIPDRSGVTVVGPGPSTGITAGDDRTAAPATRRSTTDRTQFVANYLAAAAGDYDGAVERVREFMAPETARTFKPVNLPRVIRVLGDPLINPGQPQVRISYELIGTLGKNGSLEPGPEPVQGEYEMTLGTAPDGSLYVQDAPENLLLSSVALEAEYQRRTIYFWNTEHTGLVPDVRYMLRDVPVVQEPTTILGWLIGGPASWLLNTVDPLPEGTTTLGKVVPAVSNQKLQINLSAQAVPTKNSAEALDRLRRQLQWSLLPLLPEYLDLTIGHQETQHYSTTDFLTSNAAFRLERGPERFAVYGGKVVRLSEPAEHAVASIPAIPPQENKGLRAAALSTSATHTFVTLISGSGRSERLRVGAAPTGGDAKLRPVTGLPSGLEHPVWAITPTGTSEGAVGLVLAGGRLYSFRAEGGAATQVPWPAGSGRISAVSVAPDGHRAAFVVDGRLYRAVLAVSGEGVSISDPDLLRPPLTSVTAVAFSSEGWLTVAGVRRGDNRVSVLDVTVDGALQYARLPDIGDEQVTYLTAYPANPVNVASDREHSGSVFYTTPDATWDALSTAVKVTPAQLAVPAAEQPDGAVPTAPFFLN